MTGYKTDRHRTENGANSVAGRSRTSSFPIGQDSLQNEISRSGYKQYGITVPRITGLGEPWAFICSGFLILILFSLLIRIEEALFLLAVGDSFY